MAAPALHPGSRHEIAVRRPDFPFDADIPNHWLADNAVATHVFNGLNLVFPDGERFFIDAVRSRMDRIDDPELQRQIRGFFGQEGRHAHEHERYFERLEAQGYEIAGFLRRFRAFARFTTRWLPAPLRLSMTAGAEHYTATLGAQALTEDLIDQAHPVMRDLIVWHATEEIEHKAVAFDVLQATHPSPWLRRIGFVLATVVLLGWTLAGTRMLIRQDLAAGRLTKTRLREMRDALRERRERGAAQIGRRIRDYMRRDFHPNDVDDLALAQQRLRELGLSPA
ncbi:MAG: metal-dependent hydrolase [Myxococcota bacterium]